MARKDYTADEQNYYDKMIGKGLTPDEAALKVVSRRKKMTKKAGKKDALEIIAEFVRQYGDENVKKALGVYAPSLAAPGTVTAAPRTSKGFAILVDLFPAIGASQNEDSIFTSLRFGRAEMKTMIKRALKAAAPDERRWISFNAIDGIYTLEAIGAEAPEGWKGYKPLSVDGEEIV